AVLSQVPGVLLAMYHVVNHAEYSCPVASYQLVKCFGITGLASSHQVQFRHIDLSQSRFRLHDWTESTLFHSTPKVFGAETATPLFTIFTHESDNAVAHLKEPLLQHRMLGSSNQLRRLSELRRCVHCNGDRLQGPLQVRDRHPDFVDMVVAQGRSELGASQRGMPRQLQRHR